MSGHVYIKLEVINDNGKCCELLLKVKKAMKSDIHVSHMYIMARHYGEQIMTDMTNFCNQGKVELNVSL